MEVEEGAGVKKGRCGREREKACLSDKEFDIAAIVSLRAVKQKTVTRESDSAVQSNTPTLEVEYLKEKASMRLYVNFIIIMMS